MPRSRPLHAPRLEGEDQTKDIDFTAAKYDAEGKKTKNAVITVKHNGVLIHDKAPVNSATTAAGLKEGPIPGPIQLQDHGNPIRFRNIWIRGLPEQPYSVTE